MFNQLITVYVGDTNEEVANIAKSFDNTARLVDSTNFKNLSPGTYYTSLGDTVHFTNLADVFMQAGKIVYCPPTQPWSDNKQGQSDMKRWTEFLVQRFYSWTTVEVFPPGKEQIDHRLDLVDSRKTEKSQLWVVGCSISHGVGVEEHEKYGSLLANELNMPVSFLTANGSSTIWAADQILRSDICSGDIVIWGLPHSGRFPYYDTRLHHVVGGYYKQHPSFDSIIPIEELDSANTQYRSIISVHQVNQYCKKIGANLLICGMVVGDNFLPYVYNLPNYLQFYGYPDLSPGNRYLDLGTDKLHPGPLTHQWYCENIIKKLKNVTMVQ